MHYQITSNSNHPLLNIYSIGYSSDPLVTRFGPGQRNQYIIHYVLSGKGYFNNHPVSSRQGFLITPQMIENYYPDKEDPWSFLWIISDDPKMKDLFLHYHADKNTNIFRFSFVNELNTIIEQITKSNNSFYPASKLLDLFLKIFNFHFNENSGFEQRTNADIYVETAKNYIESNIHNTLTVTTLAKILCVSQPYLFKIFKQKLNLSPKQYIISQKICYSKKLLIHTNLSITEISSSVGFDDVLIFSRFFSSHVGVSPRKYREQQKSKAN